MSGQWCACGQKITRSGPGAEHALRRHRKRTGCVGTAGIHVKFWSRHCITCGRSA